jgi:hypothetical protein
MIRLAGPGASSADYEIASLAQLQAYMRDRASETTLLTTILGMVHRQVFNRMGGRFIKLNATAFEELYDGPGRETLYLDNWPIGTVSSVQEIVLGMGQPAGYQVMRTIPATEYLVDAQGGRLIATGFQPWPKGMCALRVIYTAGYNPIPADLIEAVCQIATTKYKRIVDNRLDKTSIGAEGESETYITLDIPASALDVLANYKKVSTAIG